ncbi:MAG TPA: COX15/CtaA family protein [Pilimelia sp.]|nr:COX15/CtaA family protein [Pilimelia sp.]
MTADTAAPTVAPTPPAAQPSGARRRAVRRWALASIAVNAGIVVTGGAVRLTNSGLGCPTWPRCTADSYVTTPEMGVHGAIEFGNRMLTFVVGLVALGGLVAAWRLRPRVPGLRGLALAVFLGIGVQGVVGGITVRLALHPMVVGLHFLLSMGLLVLTYAFWWRARGAPPPARGRGWLAALGWAVTAATVAVLAVGTLVTGSGPHSGDSGAARNGLDPEFISKAHAASVYLLVALTVALLAALCRRGGAPHAVRAVWVLLGTVAAQGAVGFVQYYTGLPVLLVGAHLLGACAVWLAALHVLAHVRAVPRAAAPAAAGG